MKITSYLKKEGSEQLFWSDDRGNKIVIDGGIYYFIFADEADLQTEWKFYDSHRQPLFIIGNVPVFFVPFGIPVADNKAQVSIAESSALLENCFSELGKEIKVKLKEINKEKFLPDLVLSKDRNDHDILLLLSSRFFK